MTEILIGQILDIKYRLKKKFLKFKIYPSWVQNKLQYLAKLIKKLNLFLNIPKQIKTCISCLEICLSDDDQPRCYECKQDNILQLESKLCLCGKKIPCVEKDGITRTKNTCKNCTTKHVPKMNTSCVKKACG